MSTEDATALDAEDMARLAAGDDLALNDLMNRHAEKVFHYLQRQLRNEAEAGDLAQETFLRVYTHRTAFRPDRRFTTWLYCIATNLVRDQLRWRQRHATSSIDEDREELPEAQPGPDAQAVAHERAAAVRAAIAGLPEDLRTPLLLAEYESLSQQEIAHVIGGTPKSVEMKLYRARQKLREVLVRWLE